MVELSDYYETPPEIFLPLHEEFHFTLDVCASALNAKCPRYFNELQDGLVQSWAGEMCWCNPPYSRGNIEKWLKKAHREWGWGCGVVMLLPADTSTHWFHRYVAPEEHRFLEGRIRFLTSARERSGSPKFGSMLLILRRK